MRKLNLASYPTHRQNDEGKRVMFDVRGSAVELLFMDGHLHPVERMKREALAVRLESESGDTMLLEEADWDRLHGGLAGANMPGREFNEFVRRIIEAPTVTVQERPST